MLPAAGPRERCPGGWGRVCGGATGAEAGVSVGWLKTEGRRDARGVSVCEYVAGCGPPQPDRFRREYVRTGRYGGAAQDTERERERVCGEGYVHVCVEKRQ